MIVRDAKYSKKLKKEIYPLTVEFVEWCKNASESDKENLLQKSYNEDIAYWEEQIKKNYEEYEGRPLDNLERLNDIIEKSGKKFIAESNKGYFRQVIDSVCKDGSMIPDEDYLYALEERQEIEREVEWFYDYFGSSVEKKNIDSMDTQDFQNYVIRFMTCLNAQADLCARRETISNLVKHIEGGTLPMFMHQKHFSNKQNMAQYMLEEDEIERELHENLMSLLRKKLNRDSIEFVYSNLVNKEKLVKSRKKSALELIESLDRAEDIYKIDKRVPGSAYSGKRQK